MRKITCACIAVICYQIRPTMGMYTNNFADDKLRTKISETSNCVKQNDVVINGLCSCVQTIRHNL